MGLIYILEAIAAIIAFALFEIVFIKRNPFSTGGKVEAAIKDRLGKIEKHRGLVYFTLKDSPIDLFELGRVSNTVGI